MEPLHPLLGIQEAVTSEPFAEERLSIEEALRMYTLTPLPFLVKKTSKAQSKLANWLTYSSF